MAKRIAPELSALTGERGRLAEQWQDAIRGRPVTAEEFGHLAGRGMHELRTDELAQYVVSLAAGHGPFSHAVKAALDWIVSELERKTNDERALAVKLDALRAAPQQAEPISEIASHGCHYLTFPDRICNKCGRIHGYSHPPADEVQRLREAARGVCDRARASQWAAGEDALVPASRLDALLAALEGCPRCLAKGYAKNSAHPT